MYKIMHGLSPQYLQDILNPFNNINNQNNNGYALRQTRIFNPPICRTNNYFDSFIPLMCRTINTSDNNLFNSPSLSAFKHQLNKDVPVVIESTQIFKTEGDRRVNIILCQLRNLCSNLNSHLYTDHLSDDTSCAFENETISHYFLECPLYDHHRLSLFTSTSSYANHNHIDINILLQGCPDCDKTINRQLLHDVHLYIGKSRRFNLYMI